MAKIGYARVSTTDQSLSIQIEKLSEAGCSKIFSDTASGSDTKRQGYFQLIEYLRSGDTLIITRIDRIARSVLDLQKLVDYLSENEIELLALDQPVSTKTASGKAFLDMLVVFAEFELNIRKERQLEGIAAAKLKGKYKGRKPLPSDVCHRAQELSKEGLNKSEIARKLGISRNTVYKILKTRLI